MSNSKIEAVRRLTPMQEGLLFHTLEARHTGVYFEQYSCSFDTPLDGQTLKQAWSQVVARHDVLRTLFTWEGRDNPLQLVRKQVTLPWQELDWRGLSPDDQGEHWSQLLKRDRETGFDLSEAPLLRLTWIRLDERNSRFLWSFHHLLIDGWSMRLILREVASIYGATVSGRPASLPDTRSFGDFIGWLDSQDPVKAETYWTETLRGFDSPTKLSTAFATETEFTSAGQPAVQELKLERRLTNEIGEFARNQRLTLNTILQGAWAVLLGRFCAVDDVTFGATVSGRPFDLEGAEGIAGLFINTLPVRIDLSGDEPVAAWLSRIQSRQFAMREFEQTPLIDVQRWSEIPRGTPLFESILVFENFPSAAGDGVTEPSLRPHEEEYIEYSNYPLAILVVPGERMRILAVHDQSVFSAQSANRILESLAAIIEGIADPDNLSVAELPAISAAEYSKQIVDWNRTEMPWPADRCIHEIISDTGRKSPDTIALASDSGAITYRDLEERTNHLARFLTALGVARNTCIPVFMERSIDAITAILAIQKANGAYVPLDPSFPKDRIEYVLEDLATANATEGRPNLVLTTSSLVDKLPDGAANPICIDRDPSADRQSTGTPPAETADPDQLAYVIYTSGSTGRPKGVRVTHRNLVSSTTARSAYYPEDLSAFLLLSSLATDSSIAGIFWTLSSGGTLVLPRTRIEQDTETLSRSIAQFEISHLLCLPSLYGLLLDHGDVGQFESLRAVIVAGEACSRDIVDRHFDIQPAVSLYNEYGPTEGTVWATVSKLERNAPVTIGKPIANTQVYILDEDRRPVPIGLPGELYIGGSGVADGYLNQPDRTAERFIADTFGGQPGDRLYRTGDRVRYLEYGNIAFLGRVDNQIKIRGYRVEPEEIERVIQERSDVSEAIVLVTTGPPDMYDASRIAPMLEVLEPDDVDKLLSEIEQLTEEEATRLTQKPATDPASSESFSI